MKINISRQNIYLLLLSVFLLIFVLIFAFALLIPEGKEYRNKRAELRKESAELRKYENFRDEVLEKLTQLKSDNRNIRNQEYIYIIYILRYAFTFLHIFVP